MSVIDTPGPVLIMLNFDTDQGSSYNRGLGLIHRRGWEKGFINEKQRSGGVRCLFEIASEGIILSQTYS